MLQRYFRSFCYWRYKPSYSISPEYHYKILTQIGFKRLNSKIHYSKEGISYDKGTSLFPGYKGRLTRTASFTSFFDTTIYRYNYEKVGKYQKFSPIPVQQVNNAKIPQSSPMKEITEIVNPGFSGSYEFYEFPLKTLFYSRHKTYPQEHFLKNFKQDYVEEFIKKHKIIASERGTFQDKDFMQYYVLDCGTKTNPIYALILHDSFNASLDSELYIISLLFKSRTEAIEKFITELKKNLVADKEPEEEGYLNVLVQSPTGGFMLEKKKIQQPDIDFDINYNEDFKEVHEIIENKLQQENSKGIVLLHGIPGTGKTTYIRYLINHIKKTIIFIPPNIASCLADPSLIKFLLGYQNSVLIIEDAENALRKRVSESSQATANILNLTDGLLSDCINIQVVATFNTKTSDIDPALMRKGRLIAEYEFKELSADRKKKLAEKLNIAVPNKGTLAEIYNSAEKSFDQERKAVGFTVQA